MTRTYEAEDREATFVSHAYPEHRVDLGEIRMNYATVGAQDLPALLLIPGQSESWWGYEAALALLEPYFQVFAVDLRGQGRSSWTPGRYTLDNMGNDLVRFIDQVIKRPTLVSGLSSGGVLSAWLSAYAKPDQIVAAHYEDPPLFASEVDTSCGQSLRQGVGAMFQVWSKYLGDQWTVGDWDKMLASAPDETPAWMAFLLPSSATPLQNMLEYDPEWARAFHSGTVAQSCDHARMLASVKVPVLFTHHIRFVDDESGLLMGASSDRQAARAKQLVTGAGQPFDYRSFPDVGHSMHGEKPQLFVDTLLDWVSTLS